MKAISISALDLPIDNNFLHVFSEYLRVFAVLKFPSIYTEIVLKFGNVQDFLIGLCPEFG